MAGDEASLQFLAADLAPGDTRSMELTQRDLDVARIHSSFAMREVVRRAIPETALQR